MVEISTHSQKLLEIKKPRMVQKTFMAKTGHLQQVLSSTAYPQI
jgi:hypothetical protein